MQKSKMQKLFNSSLLSCSNQYYIEKMYKNYLKKNNLISSDWKKFFENLSKKNKNDYQINNKKQDHIFEKKNEKIVLNNTYHAIKIKRKIKKLIENFRKKGHLKANLDPLNLYKKPTIPDLDISFYKFTELDLNSISYFFIKQKMKIKEIYNLLKKIYCSSIGIEYTHISNEKEKNWIQQYIEKKEKISEIFKKEEKINFLSHLMSAEWLERYIGLKFPGAKRFSLEGCEALIPMIKEIIYYSSNFKTKEIIFGMAHRGRINVLVNIFGKKTKDLFEEFSGKKQETNITGDVKYHQGLSCDYYVNESIIHTSVFHNPSHLEIINPVITGSVRARIDRLKKKENNVLPITIHGDASVIAQGIVQETLNISQVPGYTVGGTIRIIINNQIGFTTSNPIISRTTKYCTDIMKMIEAPIFHVNADDIESVIFITRLAIEFRNKFKKDIVIDLVCYRRHGHNEADEPSATQPIMYKKIRQHKTVFELYSDQLIQTNNIQNDQKREMIASYRKKLEKGKSVTEKNCKKNQINSTKKYFSKNEKYSNKYYNIKENELKKIAKKLNTIPNNIIMQERVKKIYQERLEMIKQKKLIDWGFGETLAYASLLYKGINIRLTGEDVSRGTFFHRHAIIHNQLDGSIYKPLCNIKKNQGEFNVWDSVLSEEAVLAFEYGYASTEPETLTIWEAQFGDFSNVAQVVIDQFISSSEQKWGRLCGLVMLLPHGYEGQGPEHSSARLERYLQLCAEKNMQICIPSTPVQIYHLLRKQILQKKVKPLIIMSPKSLLRHNLATSNFTEFTNLNFKKIINETDKLEFEKIKRIILCSGKIYYDILENRRKNQKNNIAIIRIEQLYPFPYKDLQKQINDYKNVQDFIWCQEEPYNQGAWMYIKEKIKKLIPKECSLIFIGRNASASPAVGFINIHQKQQKKIIKKALKINN